MLLWRPDLAVAVVVGVIISALVFAWQHAKYIRIEAREDHNGSTVYAVTGPLFFGSATSFTERFDPKQDNDDVIIDFARSRVADHSALKLSMPWQSAMKMQVKHCTCASQ